MLSMLAAVQMALQPAAAPPPPTEIAYLPVAGGEYHAIGPAERLIRDLAAEPGPHLRRADLASDGFRECLERFDYIDHAETCLRPLVPREHRGAPLVLVFVEEVRRSNVTGSVVNKTLTVRCVGTRAVARAELSGTLDTEFAVRQAREPVRKCLADAARTPEQATIDPATGAASWRFPLRNGGLLRDLPLARGNALERAIVDIEEIRPEGRTAGQDCSLHARVTRVIGGWWLRAGDRVELGIPCGTNGVLDGRPALMHVNFERELHFLEAL